MLALKTVIDIPEQDMVLILHDVIRDTSTRVPNDAMQIDSAMMPALTDVLSLCVDYPISAPSFRLSIHRQIREADELNVLLEILLGWMQRWCSEDVVCLLPAKVTPKKVRRSPDALYPSTLMPCYNR